MRTRLLLILMVVLGAFPAALAATPAEAQIAQCAGAEPTISLSPISGPSGTQVTLRYRNFDPGDPLKVIFRSAGDPVVATGTADADGEGRLVFTVPSAPDGLYWVYVECHTAAHFRIGPVTPTVTSSPTQSATPTNTPAVTRTPAPPTPVNTVAPPPPTPLAPVAGEGLAASSSATSQFNLFALAAALAMAAAGFGSLGLGANITARRRAAVYATVTWWPGVPRKRSHQPDAPGHAISPEQLERRMRGPR